MQPKKTEAIKTLLKLWTHADLEALYNFNMECQVNVLQLNGEAIQGEYQGRRWRGWRNPQTNEVWKPFRIPWNANSEPIYEDTDMKYDLAKYAEAIGMTGWDWKEKLSRWVGFDFDAITGHSDKHTKKLSEQELFKVRNTVENVSWVTLRKSTGGKGLHLYVFLQPVPTANHNEHAALARAVLGQLSGLCGVDFKSKVDVCGGNMWIWHRKMQGTDGLKLLKQGEILTEIPPYWQDHLKVVKGERRKVTPFFVGEIKQPDAEDLFEQLSGQRVNVPLDDDHMKFLNLIKDISKGSSWWDSDHHMLITHTVLIKEAAEQLQMRGKFDTVATGKDKGHDHNCFAFPMRKGAWTVRRYTPGIAEIPSWEQDGQGWTRCFLNKEPDLGTACRTYEGKEHPAGGYVFTTGEQAMQAANMLGANLDLPNYLMIRKARLKQHPKDGRLIAEIVHESGDPKDPKMDSWIPEKGSWKKVFQTKVNSPMEAESANIDDTIRHVIAESNTDIGWMVKANDEWNEEPLSHVKPAMTNMGMKPVEINSVIGASIFRPWKIVCRPFQPEYPGDRQWNMNAPQLRFTPIEEDILQYPTWQRILKQIGRGLDEAIQKDEWSKANGIITGADYLMCWIASLIKEPMEPLPYLFLWSPEQNRAGKSMFHESLRLLLTRGYMDAKNSLTNQGNFNAELKNTVLCYIEEIDLKRNKVAYERIKEWVTSPMLPIHKKGETPYLIPNTTHWVQTANSHLAVPVFTGDSRITMIQVPPMQLSEMIPKKQLFPLLEKEAPHFITALLNLELPPSHDRLNVPVISTEQKIQVENANMSLLEIYIKEKCYNVDGEVMLYGLLYENFREWVESIDPAQLQHYSKIRFGRELPPHFPKGRLRSNPNIHVGNISFAARLPNTPVKKKYILTGEYIEPGVGIT